jgi:hypothetical protein
MTIRTNNPAAHAGEKEAPAIPKDGQTPGMGAPPTENEREPGTRSDGEAMPPGAIDPGAQHTGKGIPPLPEPNVEGVGKESGHSANTSRNAGSRDRS